jgi:hypothetical protein
MELLLVVAVAVVAAVLVKRAKTPTTAQVRTGLIAEQTGWGYTGDNPYGSISTTPDSSLDDYQIPLEPVGMWGTDGAPIAGHYEGNVFIEDPLAPARPN